MSGGNGGGANAPTAHPFNATERALQLLRAAPNGLSAEELRADELLGTLGSSTVSTIPPYLRKQGLIESAGFKRGKFTVWRAVANPVPPPPPPPKSTRKADQVLAALKDEGVREEVKRAVAEGKGTRAALAALTAAEKELEAARLDQEKREADAEREQLRLIEIARGTADKSIKTWERLAAEVRAAWTMIAAYAKVTDDLPALHPAFERTLARELDELRLQLDWLDNKLSRQEHSNPIASNFIDV